MFFISTKLAQSKKTHQNKYLSYLLSFNLLLTSAIAFAQTSNNVISLEQAQQIALQNEPGISSQQFQAQALTERAIAEDQLVDPKLQLGLNNMPLDSFNFNQENMTQFKVGIIQQFPAGDTLGLKKQKTLKQAELFDSKIADRELIITKQVRINYLEIYYLEHAKTTLVENKKLFGQLVAIVQSMFSVGKNNQQDLIQVQLELSRLDDRISTITQKINLQRSKLSRWIGSINSQKALTKVLPKLVSYSPLQQAEIENDFANANHFFDSHPKIQQIDKLIEIKRKDIQLAKESYKPGWGLNVSYGYRDSNPNGASRSDFVSAGVTMDLPFFTANRQDKKLLSNELQYNGLKDQRIELMRQLLSQLQEQRDIEEQLLVRHQLYKRLILPQAQQQTEAALLAYQSDRSDFADVMRAYIDDLNAKLDDLRIDIDRLQTKSRILYFLSTAQIEIN